MKIKSFAVQIVSCTVSALWYAGRIGQKFDVIDGIYPNENSYTVIINGNRKAFHIRKYDCVMVEKTYKSLSTA